MLESVRSDMDGSGTFVNASGTSGNAFDLYLPRSGWKVVVKFSDAGGAGIDDTTFSAKASVAVGSNGANAELGGSFSVNSLGAEWRIPAGTQFATGNNITFSPEMVRRAVWSRMVAQVERPFLRDKFKHKNLLR